MTGRRVDMILLKVNGVVVGDSLKTRLLGDGTYQLISMQLDEKDIGDHACREQVVYLRQGLEVDSLENPRGSNIPALVAAGATGAEKRALDTVGSAICRLSQGE